MNRIRCAIYTRKSSKEGLEQDFNSLDAQYRLCPLTSQLRLATTWRAL
jgi:site-specific DNA recombinase